MFRINQMPGRLSGISCVSSARQFSSSGMSSAWFKWRLKGSKADTDANNRLKINVTADELNRVRDKDQLNQQIQYLTAGLNLKVRKLPPNFRRSVSPIYIGPHAKQVSLARRISLGFAAMGIYVSKVMWDIDIFLPELSQFTLAICCIPYPLIYYATFDYVAAIHRVYDSEKAQTLENLIQDESFIVSKLSWTGARTRDHLVRADSLTLSGGKSRIFKEGAVWESIDPDNEIPRHYFIHDNVGGIKMDRIWGVVEAQSGVDNGRSFWLQK